MKNYNSIRTICEENSRISAKVIDKFLIYYAAGRNNLEQSMNRRFAVYNHIARELKKEWINMLRAQYLAHEIFKQNGIIKKLLNHAELQRLTREEKNYLEIQAKQPWRFSFSVITGSPASDFYVMEDIFSGEQFTLFSPGTTDLIRKQSPILWSNLIGYNGACWQSYGPIGTYRGFDPDDIYFFGTELNPETENEQDIMDDIESNPVPYMMLLSGANYPMAFHKKDQMVQVMSEFDLEEINTKEFRISFRTEYTSGVYRFTLNRWGNHPHFANAYFDERKKIFILHAMTDRGFQALVTGINKYGYTFPDDPLIRVNTSMLVTAKHILKKEIVLNRYDALFQIEPSEKNQRELDKVNVFMALVLPDINAGRKPDIEELAKKAGLDVETARDIIRQVSEKFDDKEQ